MRAAVRRHRQQPDGPGGRRSRPDLVSALEVRNMLAVGQILTEAIDMRKESRGDQYREDYPNRDDAH